MHSPSTPKTIEARRQGGGDLSRAAAMAIIILWRSRQFSTADIADLLTVAEADVSRLVTVSRFLAAEVSE